jgi:WD40 repeat protein
MVDYPLGFVATCVVPSPDRILSWGYTTTNTASETHGVHAFDLKAKTKTLLKPDAVPAFDTESPESTAGHMARSSDGRTLLQGGLGFRARLWRLDGTAPRCVTSFQPEWFEPMLVDLSPSSGWALVACGQRVELWQLHLDQAYPARCASRLTGVPRNSFVMGVRFGANGKTALAATDEGELLTWDLSRLVQ